MRTPGEDERATILIVDDTAAVRAAVAGILEHQLQAKVLVAEGAADAFAALEREDIDLIISDYRMDPMDGVAFLSRCAQRWPHIPRILLTAYGDIPTVKRALNEGRIAKFLEKPVRAATLVTHVQAALDAASRAQNTGRAFDRARRLLGSDEPEG